MDYDFPIGPLPQPPPSELAWHDQVVTRASRQLDLLVEGYGRGDYLFGQYHNEVNLAESLHHNIQLSRADLIDIMVVAIRRLSQHTQPDLNGQEPARHG